MAYLDNTKKDFSTPARWTLCLLPEECEIMLPTIKKALKEAEQKYEKYLDIQEGGEATTKEQNLLCKYEDRVGTLSVILEKAEELIKTKER